MKKITCYILTTIIALCLAGFSHASLIGDVVDIIYSDPSFTQAIQDVLVEENVVEAPNMLFSTFNVDIEADSVIIDFNRINNFGSASFAGLIIDDLNDFDNSDFILLGVDVTTNLLGWEDNRLLFDEDTVSFNWQGLDTDANTSFTAIFQFGPNPIPIPTSALLFVTGIIGFALIRRKITH